MANLNLKPNSIEIPFLKMYDLIIGSNNYLLIPKNQMKIFIKQNNLFSTIKTSSKIYKEKTLHLYRLAIELLIDQDGLLIENSDKQMKHIESILSISLENAKKARIDIFSLYFEKKVYLSMSNLILTDKKEEKILHWKKYFKLDNTTAKNIKIKVASRLYESFANDFIKNGFLQDDHRLILNKFRESLGFKIKISDELLSNMYRCELRWQFKNGKICPIDIGNITPLHYDESVYINEKIMILKIDRSRIQPSEEARILLTNKRIIIVSSTTIHIMYPDLKDISFNGDMIVIRNKLNSNYIMIKTNVDLDPVLLQIVIDRMIRDSVK